MKLAALSIVVAGMLSVAMGAPQRQRISKETIAAERQALRDLNNKPVDPKLNGSRILSNGQGSCFAVQGRASCQDSVGNSI
ncbi:hypothetical protein MAPG_08494 [Magnaporthiopsis poae ATCC 64411]|uniref:Uncharacterized protein n=1 Tax=Magnaporthiopsis poae (strain ATCC 64411 / 73-15) TaxID=644358 RepID=A0A0C4E7I1_MAGP6|nr:hypothetical protein MAPG_08494 [Magnaporthiopsis poae ATCC 64411]